MTVVFYSPAVSKKRQVNEENVFDETPQEKKLRLAKLYLDQLKEEGKCFCTALACNIVLCDLRF